MSVNSELGVLKALATEPLRGASTRLGLAGDVPTSVVRDGDGIAHVRGDLERFVANFVEASPQRNSLNRIAPGDAERAMLARGWQLLRRGDVGSAAEVVEPTGMRIIRFTDVAGPDAVNHALLELAWGSSRLRGLGMYVQRQGGGASGLHIQVPHPWDDIATEVMGVGAYRGADDSSTLSVAGASRFAMPNSVADAAHSRETLFHALAGQPAAAGVRQLQLHGFREARHPGYGKAVVSTGDDPTPAARALRDAIADGGMDARLAGDGRPYVRLAGRKNVQGIDARDRGATWLHVEIGDSIRMDPRRRERAVAALVEGARAID